MVLDQAVGLTALDQVVGRVAAGGVHEAADDLMVAVQFSDGAQAVLIGGVPRNRRVTLR